MLCSYEYDQLLKKPISFQMQNVELDCFDVHSQLSHFEYKIQIETLLKKTYNRRTKTLIENMHFVIEYVIFITQNLLISSYEKA